MKPRRALRMFRYRRAIKLPFLAAFLRYLKTGNKATIKQAARLYKQTRLLLFEMGYVPHLGVRYLHDHLYHHSVRYKKYHDHPATENAHRAALAGFVASFLVFGAIQYALPSLFDIFRAGSVQASASSTTWTTTADFKNNSVTTGDTTSRLLETLPGTVSVTSGSTTVTGTGTNFLATVDLYTPKQIAINGITYMVSSVSSNTSLQLSNNYPGVTSSGLVPTRNSDVALPGTVTLTNGSAIVAGNGTNFSSSINTLAVKQIRISGVLYSVSSVASNTSLTLASAFTGTTAAGLPASSDEISINNNAVSLRYDSPVITKTSTFVIPAGVTSVNISIAGAGGGGGGGGYQSTSGSAGGNSSVTYNGTTYTANGGGGGPCGDGCGSTVVNGGTTGNAGWTSTTGGGSLGGGGGWEDSAGGPGFSGGNGGLLTKSGFTVTPGQTMTIVTGTGGGGGVGGLDGGGPGGTGATGSVQVSYTFASYASSGTLSGLKFDAGVGMTRKWSQLSWNTVENATLPANTSIKFRVATSTNGTSWLWSGYYTQSSGSSYSTALTTVSSRYLQLEATLTSGSVSSTPLLNDVTVSTTTDPPPLGNMSISSTSNSTFSSGGTEGAFTRDTMVGFNVPTASLTCTDCGTSTNRRAQVEVKSTATAFSAAGTEYVEDGGSGDLDMAVNGTILLSKTTQASPVLFAASGAYHWRARTVDDEGRVSTWTNYGVGSNTPTAVADFTIEQSSPVVDTVTLSGNTSGSTNYINDITDHKIAKVSVPLSDNLSTSLKVQFSEDGVNGWGVYNGAADGSGSLTLDNDWGVGSYKTIKASNSDGITPNQAVSSTPATFTIPNAWKFTNGDGSRPLYVRVKDMAGNVSGQVQDTTFTASPAGDATGFIVSDNALILSSTTTYPVSYDGFSWSDYLQSGEFGVCLDSSNSGTDDSQSVLPTTQTNFEGLVSWQASYMEFNNGLATGLTSAKIRLTSNKDATIQLYSRGNFNPFTDCFDAQDTPTYDNPITISLTTGTHEYDVTALVAADIAAGRSKTYISTAIPYSASDNTVLISSQESGDSTMPKLNLIFPFNQRSFTSGILNSNKTTPVYGKFMSTAATPGNSGLAYQVRTGSNSTAIDGTWSSWTTVTSGQTIDSVLALADKSKPYIQYRATFTPSTDYTKTPLINSVVVHVGNANSDTILLDTAAPGIAADIITAPAAAANLKGGTTNYGIVWNNDNVIDTTSGLSATAIKLEYYDGTSWSTVANASATANDGSHIWPTVPSLNADNAKMRLTATDNAGNVASQETGSFVIDSTAPTSSVGSLDQYYVTPSITVPYNANDQAQVITGYGPEYQDGCFAYDGSWLSNEECQSGDEPNIVSDPIYANINLSGVANVRLYYTRQTAAPYTWTVYPSASTPSSFTSSPATFNTAAIADVTKNGNYGFKVVATDNAGNVGVLPNTSTSPDAATYIDFEIPGGSVVINSGEAATSSLSISAAITLADSYSGLKRYRVNDGTNWGDFVDVSGVPGVDYSTTAGITIPNTDQGNKTISVEVTDNAGNIATITDSIAYDYTPPETPLVPEMYQDSSKTNTLSMNGFTSGWYFYSNPYITFKSVDNESGVEKFKYCIYKSTESCDYDALAPVNASLLGDTTYIGGTTLSLASNRQGVLNITVKSVDFAGNESQNTSNYVYKFDSTLPTTVLNLEASPSENLALSDDSITIRWRKFNANSSTSPAEKYKLERIEATGFVVNANEHTSSPAYDGNWSSATGYQAITCNTYAPNACTDKDGNVVGNLGYDGTYYSFIDSAGSDPSLKTSLKYVFRVSAKDYANTAFGALPNSPDFAIYGYTRDSAKPEVAPMNVSAAICDKNDSATCLFGDTSAYGHQVHIAWDRSEDYGTGVGYYYVYRRVGSSLDPSGWTVVGKVVEGDTYYNMYAAVSTEVDPSGWQLVGTQDDSSHGVADTRREFWDSTVDDAVSYSYRVTAFDKATPGEPNETFLSFTLGTVNGVPDQAIEDLTFMGTLNASPSNVPNVGILTPDVTAPTMPDDFSVKSSGIDTDKNGCSPYVLGTTCQKVAISWTQTNDNTYNSQITYKVYQSTDPNNGFVELTDETKYSTSFDPNGSNLPTLQQYVINIADLEDLTNYYYKVEVSDASGNVVISDPAAMVSTGNSKAPTAPSAVSVYNNTSGVDDPAHELQIFFHGSTAPAFDESDLSNGVVKYDIYATTSNKQPDVNGYTTVGDTSDNCGPSESADDCWIRINNATIKKVIDLEPTNDAGVQRDVLIDGLSESTQYFFRIRATDNGLDAYGNVAPLTSLLSSIPVVSSSSIHTGSWDVTRDLTAPPLPAGGLAVTVKDTHPNSTVMRNIVSWKILDQTSLRKKQSYETNYNASTNPKGCKLVTVDSVQYCNDFYSYEVYRQILDSDGNVIYESPSPIRTELNPETNYYIDEIGNTDTIGGIGGSSLLIDSKIRYYVRVVDASNYSYNYPDGSSINAAPNKTEKQYSSDTIIPAKAIPSILGDVTLSNIGVSTAEVNWTSDQDTDSLVQYRVSGTSDAYVTVGQVERTQNHKVKLFGMKPNTAYEYRLVSRNYLDNMMTYDQSALPGLTTTGFTVNFNNTVTTTTGATIKWTTNLDASSAYIEYQMNKQPGDEPQGKTVGVEPDSLSKSPKSHTVVVSGLKSNRAYTYKIKSISTDGYVAESAFLTFSTKAYDTAAFTMAPASSNVAERDITSTSAQIVWTTATPTTTWVRYGTTAGKYTTSVGDNNLSMTHAIKIDGLVPGTKYFYIVDVKDANDTPYTSQEYSFTAVLKPQITSFQVTQVKPYSVSIAWTTNVDTETLINWGKNPAYGEKYGKPGYTKTHTLEVTNLEDNTEYHFQILAQDETGNEVADADHLIRTPMDTQGPTISAVKVDLLPMGENDTTSSVIISWTTDKPATTLVEYDQGLMGGAYNNRTTEDKSLNTSHTVIIKNLQPAASYHYRIVTADKRGNTTRSDDYTFVTPTKEASILDLIIKSLEETFSWTTKLNEFFGNIGKRLTGKS